MHRQVGKQIFIVLVSVSAICAVAIAGMMWRLSQGPVQLSFLTQTIQDSLNGNLRGMTIAISDVVIERDSQSGQTRFLLRDLALHDLDDNLIARAPRASVGVDGKALLGGNVVANKLELIGPRLLVRRKIDGSFQLGFGDGEPSGSDEARSGPSQQPGAAPKSSREDRIDKAPEIGSTQLLDFINTQVLADAAGPLSSIDAILVSRASISLFDEGNNAVWYAPQSNLVFKRALYGFAVFVDARIASGAEPWRSEVVVTYRKVNRSFTISARVFDLIPADLADIFALTQLAQVKLPLSGHIEAEFSDEGVMTSASAELSASKGRLDFPEYIARPILVDEGLLRFDYEPSTGGVRIGNSAIFVEGVRSELSGRITPRRTEAGRLDALDIALSVNNLSIDASDQSPLTIDRIEFEGAASVDRAELEVTDLVLVAQGGGTRIRGRFVGEGGAVGLYLAGRMKDIKADVVKRLWPPIVAPGARNWVQEHVRSATIPDGTFQLGIPGETLVAAIRDKVSIPNGLVDVRFSLDNVSTAYFDSLPPIVGAAGKGRISGDRFTLELAGGHVQLPSGKRLNFVKGTMDSKHLAPLVTPTVIRVTGAGKARDFLELIDQKPLQLVSESGFDPERLQGDAQLNVTFSMPLQKNMNGDLVDIQATAKLTDAGLKRAFNEFDIESGTLDLTFRKSEISANGPVRVAGIPVKLRWQRSFAKNGADLDDITATARLDRKQRNALGVDIRDHVSGPIDVTVKTSSRDGAISTLDVTADLTNASLRLDPIRWFRPEGQKTSATFTVDLSEKKQTKVSNLKISGKGLKIEGDISIDGDGNLRDATFSNVYLNDSNHFAIAMKRRNGNLALAVSGKAFDARPIINSMFSSNAGGLSSESAEPIAVEASIARVVANRGEVITNLAGQFQIVGGSATQANLQGRFLNGAPITMRITPTAGGIRKMRVVGNDSGGALRASNLYSKISGGSIDFKADLNPAPLGGIRKGKLVVRNFDVRNEAAITSIDQRSRKRKSGPRRDSIRFSKLTVPFSTDNNFVLIGDALIESAELGASAQGIIRKSDGGMDIGGTIIPAYAVNAAVSEIPLLGTVLTGGRGQGIFGLNFALKGTMSQPKFQINPVSAIAPGIFRRIFQIGGGGVNPDGTPIRKRRERNKARADQ